MVTENIKRKCNSFTCKKKLSMWKVINRQELKNGKYKYLIKCYICGSVRKIHGDTLNG